MAHFLMFCAERMDHVHIFVRDWDAWAASVSYQLELHHSNQGYLSTLSAGRTVRLFQIQRTLLMSE